MKERIEIKILWSKKKDSGFDWINIDKFGERLGKVRCLIKENEIIIYSLNIFSEYEGNGYARYIIDYLKSTGKVLIADRVRYSARGFWKKMGFIHFKDGDYIFREP